ncbi:hypothetical protein ILUMI_06499 [Ignelater luminosus]|uniref:Uncharacterized protein n=1 Tax=Ignelater luminosus TaxID=2038154 RepID=A0A8K0DA53_IGNLU|nr:hypothetical protein ILUMI_06499 [Ignelater luminosus]
MLDHLSQEKIEDMFKEDMDIPTYPCHTQATERCVKLVTEASAMVCGKEQRDGFIRTRIESRQPMKAFNTKKEFVV